MNGAVMTETKYAIVIVTYNRKQLLRECIRRVTNQTVPAADIIIVNNASTDGTRIYLDELGKQDKIYDIINLPQNIGGAGGFSVGIEHAATKEVECILIMDDDAMLSKNYMELLLLARSDKPQYKAFAGIVKVNGKIDLFHRRSISKAGMMFKKYGEEKYHSSYFECEMASFCGMLLDVSVVEKIGLPHSYYFICHDDAEYSLRVSEYSKFLVVTDAILDHKTKLDNDVHPRRYDWKDYYSIRNRILLVNEHGTIIDKMFTIVDILIHVCLRNWLFMLVKRDRYDWKYENAVASKAIRDAYNMDIRMGDSDGITADIIPQRGQMQGKGAVFSDKR